MTLTLSRADMNKASLSLPRLILELWHHLEARRQKQFFMLLALMFTASFAEIFSIGAVLPFLGALTAPEKIFTHPLAQPFIQFLGIENPQGLLLYAALAFCITALLAGAVRLLLLYATTRYSHAVGADLSISIYRRTLYQPYSVHVSRNSSEVINGITGKSGMIIGSVLIPVLTLIGSALILGGILAALIVVDPMIALVGGAAFGSIYSIILRATKRGLKQNSEVIAQQSTLVIKALQEGLGGIRDVLIDGTQETYSNIYWQSDRPLRLAHAANTFISTSPRYVLETLGMIAIAGFAYGISQTEGGVLSAIPILGAIALGAQRLLPILQQGYSALTIVRTAEVSLRDVLELLGQPLPVDAGKKSAPIAFRDEIGLDQVDFRYSPDTPLVLDGVDLRFAKGKRIGFMGSTGGGKSTLLDVLMGLLEPAKGALMIDGKAITVANQRAWQAHIAHVPQTIYLSDSSIIENIAFGVPVEEIDFDRVRRAAEQAQISKTIESWAEKYQTKVGERGVRLSGGQRQRIGIARALYKQADVLIFDEATSALDTQTEQAVMKAIDGLGSDLTIFIVAHRLSTLKNCDFIVELAEGGIKHQGTYAELIASE